MNYRLYHKRNRIERRRTVAKQYHFYYIVVDLKGNQLGYPNARFDDRDNAEAFIEQCVPDKKKPVTIVLQAFYE